MLSEWFECLADFDQQVLEQLQNDSISGNSRAVFRRKLGFSAAKYEAIKKGKRLEDALEKVIVWLADQSESDSAVSWFNQFNPASGAGGESREAVDFVRREIDADLDAVVLDFFELKQWNKNDSLSYVIGELMRYASQLVVMNHHNITPYDNWPRRVSIRLWCIGPKDYFQELGGKRVKDDLERFADSFERGKSGTLLSRVTVQPKLIEFPRSLTKERFTACFDKNKSGNVHPSEVVDENGIKLLKRTLVMPIRRSLKGV